MEFKKINECEISYMFRWCLKMNHQKLRKQSRHYFECGVHKITPLICPFVTGFNHINYTLRCENTIRKSIAGEGGAVKLIFVSVGHMFGLAVQHHHVRFFESFFQLSHSFRWRWQYTCDSSS